MRLSSHTLRVGVKNEGQGTFFTGLEKKEESMESLNGCPASDGEIFPIWKAFDGEVLSDSVFLRDGLPLGGFRQRSLQSSEEEVVREGSVEK